MMDSAIQELAGGENTSCICAALNKAHIELWEVYSRRQLNTFKAKFASGAKNLALHPDGRWVATGKSSSTNGTIAVYEAPGGVLLWKRDKIRYPSHLKFSHSGDILYCTIDNRRVEQIDASTGMTIAMNDGIRALYDGPYKATLSVPSSSGDYLITFEPKTAAEKIPVTKLTFALLDAAFAPEFLFLTESGGPVRCVEYNTGRELWRFDPPPGSHVLRLHWSGADESCYGILRHYEKGLFRRLLRFQGDGRAECVCQLNSWDEVFISAQHQLVTSSGDIIDLADGRFIDKLLFPEKSYPDGPFRAE